MNFHTWINQLTKLRVLTCICNLLGLLLFSCAKDVIIIPPDTNPTEVVLLAPLSNTSNNLTLSAEVRYLNNNDIILSHGFMVDGRTGDTYIKREYPIASTLKSGSFTYKIPDPEIYKEGYYYSYKYFVKSERETYLSKSDQFRINNIKVIAKEDLKIAAGEIITIEGEFTNIEKDYDLYYSFHEEKKMPFEIVNSGKAIRFKVPEGVKQGYNVTFRLISKNQEEPHLAAIIAKAFIVGTLALPTSYSYYYDDILRLPYPTDYSEKPGLEVFVGNIFLRHSDEMDLRYLIDNQKGKKFPMGYTNGRDTITFPQPLQLIEPDPNEFKVIPAYVHPGTKFEVFGSGPDKFNFGGHVTVGNQHVIYNQVDRNAKKGELTISDLPEGDYPMIMNNNHFTYKSANTIKVKKMNIASSSPSEAYAGDKITLKGTFVKGQSYTLEIDKTNTSSTTCTTTGEVNFEIPQFMTAGKYQIKMSYKSDMDYQRSYYSNSIPLEIKATTITAIYPLKASTGDLITIEGHGLKGYQAQIATVEARHTLSQNNKIQFEIPNNLPKGKYRINISFTNFGKNNTITATDYLEIN